MTTSYIDQLATEATQRILALEPGSSTYGEDVLGAVLDNMISLAAVLRGYGARGMTAGDLVGAQRSVETDRRIHLWANAQREARENAAHRPQR